MYVLDYIFISSFAVCRTPSLLSLLVLTALRRFPKMFRWKTVGMRDLSFSLPATCVLRVGDPQRVHLIHIAATPAICCRSAAVSQMPTGKPDLLCWLYW